MPNYTIDDVFDASSPYYNGALSLDVPPASRNTAVDGFNPIGVNQVLMGDTTKDFFSWDGETLALNGQLKIGGTIITVTDSSRVQSAIDEVSLAGGGTVNLAPGTYNFTSDITISDSVTLAGVGATIDFGNTAHQILIQGTNPYITGTISATHGSTTITGAGTVWTPAMVGQSILVGEVWYDIVARSSNTSLTVDRIYQGIALSGEVYAIATPVFGTSITGLTVQNSSVSLIKVIYANLFTIDGAAAISGTIGLDIQYSSTISILNSGVDNCGTGMYIFKAPFGALFNSNVQNSTSGGGVIMLNTVNWGIDVFGTENVIGPGIQFTNCNDCGIENFSVIHTTGIGVEFVSTCNSIGIVDGYIVHNTSDGIKFDASTTGIEILATTLTDNGGYGVNIAASSCVGNIVSSNYFATNSSGPVNDFGNGTVIRGNYGIVDGQSFVALESISAGDAISLNEGEVNYLIVAGGGVGGASTVSSLSPGGGGGGEVKMGTTAVSAGTPYSIVVGASASSSSAFGLTSVAGGTGGAGGGGNGGNGGSGGGGSGSAGSTSGGTATATIGHNGGSGSGDGGGGGGGAGVAGGNSSGNNPAAGGDGISSSISGVATYYAGGGGGATSIRVSGGAGGQGGGGLGGNDNSSCVAGSPGTANTGGGGGGSGGGCSLAGGAGGTGIVIISALTGLFSPSTSGANSFTQSGGSDIWKFTASGTWTPTALTTGYGIGKSSSASVNWRFNNFIGFAPNAISNGSAGVIQIEGLATLPGLTAGSTYYLQDAVGTIGTSAGSQSKKIGKAFTSTLLSIQLPPL